MNNLPKVVAQQRRGRASNPRLLDRKSDDLPLSHRATPSVTFMYSVEMNKHIFINVSPSDSHTILVFPHQMLWQYSDGDPLMGALNAGKVGKYRDSLPTSVFIACC